MPGVAKIRRRVSGETPTTRQTLDSSVFGPDSVILSSLFFFLSLGVLETSCTCGQRLRVCPNL